MVIKKVNVDLVFTLALAHKQYYFLVFYVKLMVWRCYEIYNKKKY